MSVNIRRGSWLQYKNKSVYEKKNKQGKINRLWEAAGDVEGQDQTYTTDVRQQACSKSGPDTTQVRNVEPDTTNVKQQKWLVERQDQAAQMLCE